MGGWLSPDSKLYNGLVAVSETVIINILLIIFSLPIVTVGAALTGAHRALLEQVREVGASPVKAFWRGFTSRFWQATAGWLTILGFLVVSAWEIWAINRMDLGTVGTAFMIVVITGIILIAGFSVWFFPYLSDMSGSIKNMIRLPGLLAFKYLPRTATCLALLLVQPLLLYLNIDLLGVLVFANIVIVPAAILYMHDLMLNEPLKALTES